MAKLSKGFPLPLPRVFDARIPQYSEARLLTMRVPKGMFAKCPDTYVFMSDASMWILKVLERGIWRFVNLILMIRGLLLIMTGPRNNFLSLSNEKIARVFLLTLALAVGLMICINAIDERNDMVLFSRHPPAQSLIRPFYGFGKVPAQKKIGSLGVDFAQVYYGAKALADGEDPYLTKKTEFLDGTGRRTGYPPLIYRVYQPLVGTYYGIALLVHNYGTLMLFIATAAVMLLWFRLGRYIFPCCSVATALYLFSPIGYTHFERGQFEFFSAVALMLMYCYAVATYSAPSLLAPLAAGVMASVKWTAWPFLGTFCGFTFLFAPKNKKMGIGLLAAVIVSLLVLFWDSLQTYYTEILPIWEFDVGVPWGVGFIFLFPQIVGKFLQIALAAIALIIFFFLTSKSNRVEAFRAGVFCFALSMAILAMGFGTLTYEYRVISLLGLIPCFLIWTFSKSAATQLVKLVVSVLFSFFLIIALRLFHFLVYPVGFYRSSEMSGFYLGFGVIFLMVFLFIVSSVVKTSK